MLFKDLVWINISADLKKKEYELICLVVHADNNLTICKLDSKVTNDVVEFVNSFVNKDFIKIYCIHKNITNMKCYSFQSTGIIIELNNNSSTSI